MSKQIKVTIDPMGRPTIEAIGYAGQGCTEATKSLEAALSGGQIAARDYKDEINGVEDVEQEQNRATW